jgi:hypothetical protein
MSNHPEITTNDIVSVLERSAKTGNKKVPIFLGIYGLGKSHCGHEFALKTNRQYVDFRLPYRTFNDVRGFGIPNRERGVMEWLVDEDLPQDPNGSYAFHWEELTNAMPSVQKVAMQGMLDRKIGQYEFPEDTVMFASGNRLSHKTGVERMLAALADRLAIYHVRPDLDSYMAYLQSNGKSSEVLAYLSSNPTATYDFDIQKWDSESNLPTFRSFDRLDELAASYEGSVEMSKDPLLRAHAAACVGPKQGEQFAQFVKLTSSVGDVGKMIDEADTCRIPNEVDIKWLIACRAIVLATKDNLDQVLLLSHRLTDTDNSSRNLQAMESFVGNTIKRRKPDLMRTKAMIDWHIKHGDALSS